MPIHNDADLNKLVQTNKSAQVKIATKSGNDVICAAVLARRIINALLDSGEEITVTSI